MPIKDYVMRKIIFKHDYIIKQNQSHNNNNYIQGRNQYIGFLIASYECTSFQFTTPTNLLRCSMQQHIGWLITGLKITFIFMRYKGEGKRSNDTIKKELMSTHKK